MRSTLTPVNGISARSNGENDNASRFVGPKLPLAAETNAFQASMPVLAVGPPAKSHVH